MATAPIIIGIPTFRRPEGLRKLLESIRQLDAPEATRVLVCENDPETGAGAAVVSELAPAFPFPLEVVMEPARGISQARNRLLEEGFGTRGAQLLAMVDDDEWVEPHWLRALVEMQRQTGADALSGRARPAFDGPQPEWTRGLFIYWDGLTPLAGPVPMIWTTTNILLARSVFEKFGTVRFDPDFSLTGGGDEDYFRRLRKAGANFAYAPTAVSYEYFGPSRATPRWALERAYRIGSCNIRNLLREGISLGHWLFEFVKLGAGMAIPVLGLPLLFWSPRHRMKLAVLFTRQLGKLAAFFTHHPQVYRRVHGS
jgi:GT2 family glycosyltransferase